MTLVYKCFKKKKIGTTLGYKLGCSQNLQLPLKKINIAIFFENLIIELLILYILNKYVKLHINNMLLTI